MRTPVVVSITLVGLLGWWFLPKATAQSTQSGSYNSGDSQSPGLTSDALDPVVELQRIETRRTISRTRNSLFATSPLTPLRTGWLGLENRFYDCTGIRFGTAVNHLFQQLDKSLPGEDTFGMSTNMTLIGTYKIHEGDYDQAELTVGIDGRWGYGLPFPTDLGPNSLGSLGFTANPYGEYDPAFIVRNLFWRQGSRDAGWMYRVGRVTPDQFLSTSAHINPNGTYLPIAGTGSFAMGLPDSGLGLFAGLFLTDRLNVAGVVSDANANRFTFGNLGQGDLFTALEIQAKIMPLTDNAGYSKLTFWHNDGTRDGMLINGSTGKEGWGYFVKHEQELTCDGRLIGIARWGQSYDKSALYDRQAGVHLLLYDPYFCGQYSPKDLIHADVMGVAYNWVQPSTAGARDESNFEIFYRFPLFPYTDMTLSYQAIFDPALAPSIDVGSAFSLRLRSTF